ncbi:MAG: hypothetical protein C4293_22590, partial [Nitrospiraceae bacterium]
MWSVQRARLLVCAAIALWAVTIPVHAEELIGPVRQEPQGGDELGEPPERATRKPSEWHYGGFVDLGYLLNFNFPENHLFRNRTTTPRVNELDLNMAAAYMRKDVSEQSRWGAELLVQGGQDAKDFGFGVNLPRLPGSNALRHLGRANAS